MVKKEGNIKNVFLIVLAAFAIISFWRGVWGLMDLYLFPDQKTLSFIISIVLGIIIFTFDKRFIRHLI